MCVSDRLSSTGDSMSTIGQNSLKTRSNYERNSLSLLKLNIVASDSSGTCETGERAMPGYLVTQCTVFTCVHSRQTRPFRDGILILR